MMSVKLMYIDKTDGVDCLLCGSRGASCDQILYGNRLDWATNLCKAFNLPKEKFLYPLANAFYCLPCNNEVRKIHKIIDDLGDTRHRIIADPKLHCIKMMIVANVQRLNTTARAPMPGATPGYVEHDNIRAAILPKMKENIKSNPVRSAALIKRVPLADAEAYQPEVAVPRVRRKIFSTYQATGSAKTNASTSYVESVAYQGQSTQFICQDPDDGKITVVLDVHNDGGGITKIERIHHMQEESQSGEEVSTREADDYVEEACTMPEGGTEPNHEEMEVDHEQGESEEQPISDKSTVEEADNNEGNTEDDPDWLPSRPVNMNLIKTEVTDSIASALEENMWLLGMDGAKKFVRSKQDEEFEKYKDDFSLKEVSVVLERIPEIHVIMYDENGITTSPTAVPQAASPVRARPGPASRKAVARKSTSKPSRGSTMNVVTYHCTIPGCKMKFLLEIKRDAHIKGYHQGIKKPYECALCHKTFQCYPSYKDHDNVHLDRRMYQCSLCSKRLFTKTQLKTHLEKHKISSSKTLFVSCPVVGCKSKFPNEARREAHVKSHHLGIKKTFPCEHCDRKFKNQREVADHQNFHTGERAYQCKECPESFFMEKRLRIHVQKHHQPARYQCEFCEKKFYIRSQYKYHLRIHTKERPYKCDHCGKDFTAPKHLRHHMASHPELNLPQFKCETCDKKFSCPASLTVHQKIHTGDYSVSCIECGLGCASQSVLIKHMAKHTDERNYSCEKCGSTYKTKGCLMKHVRDKHADPENHVCKHCGKELSTRVSLQRHEMLHSDDKPFVCETCGKSFPIQYYLSAHNWKCHRSKESGSRIGRPRKRNLKVEIEELEQTKLEIEEAVPEVESGIEDVVIITM